MNQPKLKLIAYSDYICPFYYIGYHRIEKLKKEYNLDVEWRLFEIHSETPKRDALIDVLPFPKGYLEMAFANVKHLADEDGIKLHVLRDHQRMMQILFRSCMFKN